MDRAPRAVAFDLLKRAKELRQHATVPRIEKGVAYVTHPQVADRELAEVSLMEEAARLILTKHLSASGENGRILEEIARKHGVTVEDILSMERGKWIRPARFEACYRLKEERGLSWGQIAKVLKKRDHTTVIHGYQRHAEFLMETGSTLRVVSG